MVALLLALLSGLQDPPAKGGALPPAESLKRFDLPDDLEIELVLSEPEIAQPVFLNFDERGRMWVVQYLQYPNPAGLTMVSRDKHWRAVYDKVPPPPPRHFPGRDRITIHEDTDGDGRYDKHKTFVEGLNIVTAVERGRGGVWVLNPPYLLFYPDKDGDDLPDGDPEVHLEGFGLEDTHSVVNSLRWGPDGWLYAAQGSTVTARVRRPGRKEPSVDSMGQLIWRYHPETRRYEVFAEGGGNAFGVEIDAKGRVFSGHNGGDTRGFHYVQGAYLRKGFEKHGELSNPYAFGYFDAMRHHRVPRFTHNFVIDEGGALPAKYAGKMFAVAPLQGEVVLSEIQPDRSSFKTFDLGKSVTTTDRWFRPVDIKTGPDGALYVADFYESHISHRQHFEGHAHRETGRIYRIKAAGSKPVRAPAMEAKDLPGLLDHPKRWVRQTALRLIGDRNDSAAVPLFEKKMLEGEGQGALEALWALHLSGGAVERALEHKDPHVRLWGVRLLGDSGKAPAEKLARTEPSVEVRVQLAATARRLSAAEGLPILRALLLRSEDAEDVHAPLMLWWAIEAHGEAALALFEERALWASPLVREHILERLMRRFAASGRNADLLACARLLKASPDAEATAKLMAGFEKAFQGRALPRLPDELAQALGKGGSILLGVRRGVDESVREALRIVSDEKADRRQRRQLVEVLGEVALPGAAGVLLGIVERTKDEEIRKGALTSLQRYADPEIGAAVVGRFPSLAEDARRVALTLLASRKEWALVLLEAVEAGTVKREWLSAAPFRMYREGRLGALVLRVWGLVEGVEGRKEISRLEAVVRGGPGDPYRGKKLFAATCFRCHLFFDKGGQVGPDLTSARRDDVGALLASIVDPGAEIREGYENYIARTNDGRTVSGFLVEKSPQVVVLRGVDGQNVVLRADEIEEMKVTPVSVMPEGLLRGMTDEQVRDLFAYLRSSQPLND